jgi:hypothetical protein
MNTLVLICAAVGGTILVVQLLGTVLGFGDHDFDHGGLDAVHGGGDWFLGVLTVKTVVAAVTFFGIGGKIALNSGANEWSALGVAVASGVIALYLVAMLMRSLHGLRADGTARIERAVGRPATVYLRIPGDRAGAGKVHLNLQNRTVEYQAVTAGSELPTGTQVKIIAVVNGDTVEVEAV